MHSVPARSAIVSPLALISDVLQVDGYYRVPRENEVSTVTCAFSVAGMHDIILISVSFNGLLTSFQA